MTLHHSLTKPAPSPPKIAGKQFTPPPLRSRQREDWQTVLRQCGLPTCVFVLDFETFFDEAFTLKKLSTIEYITDPRFEVTGLAVLENQCPEEPFFYRGPEMVETYLNCLRYTYGPTLDGVTVVAQNARFDMGILAFRYDIHPSVMIDTKGLAQHWNARAKSGLGDLAKRFKLETQKGDTQEFKGWTTRRRYLKSRSRKKGPHLPVQRPLITEEQWPQYEAYALDDVRMEWDIFKLLLPRLSCPKTELRAMHHTLELYTKPKLYVDYARGDTLIVEMDREITKVVDRLQVRSWLEKNPDFEAPPQIQRTDVSGDNSFERLLEAALRAAKDDPQKYMKPCKKPNKTAMFAIAKDDPEREQLEQHPHPLVRALIAARLAVKSWPLHIARIKRIMAQARANGGVLPVPLNYHGAHTGRWSGAERINLQNLGSRGHVLVNAIRELLIAPLGHDLVIADASQIEARVLAWVAGQDDLVAAFAENAQVYEAFASRVLGWHVRKPRDEGGIPAIEAKHKWARNIVGKIGVLACGYGMGATKTEAYAKGALDFETAERIVKLYRSDNDKIVRFWRDLEACFAFTAQYRQPCQMPRGLQFSHADDCDVIITLPNGRELKYHDVKSSPGQYGPELSVYNAMTKEWVHIWGGHLAENMVQAMSRDILWEAIERLDDRGHDVVHHIHDEIICLVPEDKSEAVLADAIADLSVRPTWASGCPLAAEGLISKHYGSH